MAWGHSGDGGGGGDDDALVGLRAANRSDGAIVERQFYGAPMARSAEQKLALALLDGAINDLRAKGNSNKKRLDRRLAREWFMDRGEGVCSFHWVCGVLRTDDGCEFEPDYIRRGLGL